MFQRDNLNLVVSLVKGHHEAIRDQLNKTVFDFDSFYDSIAHHQLRGYVYSLLANSPAREAFPSDLVDRLQSSYIRQRTKNEEMIRELKLLSSTFSRAGQEFILLKGPYMAQRFYGSLDRRAFWDIDILVKKNDLKQAAQLLTRSGFKRTSRTIFNKALTIYFTHALDFAKPGVAVDLHWALRNRPSYNFNYQDIWGKKQPFHLDDALLYVLSDQHALVLNLISIFNDIEVAKMRLRSFVDLYMMMRSINETVDWNQFLEDRKRENVIKISVCMLDVFLTLFDCRGEFPKLAHAVSRKTSLLGITREGSIERLLRHSRVGLRHRMWAARFYEASRLRLLLWWIISSPFRRAAYRSGKSARLKRVIRRLKSYIGLRS
jgi:hypothetical protein